MCSWVWAWQHWEWCAVVVEPLPCWLMNTTASSATPSGIPPQALAGLKVIELGQLIAGPFAGKTLADFGAEVIKVEPPAVEGGAGGDPLRQWRMLHNGTSVWWQVQSRNKQSVVLDLRTDEGATRCAASSTRPTCSSRTSSPARMEKWGMGYEVLSRSNPA
jgi:formyl-CoA transferase